MMVVIMERCGTGLGGAASLGGVLTGAAVTRDREGLEVGSCGIASSNAAVSIAVQLVIKDLDCGRVAVLIDRPARTPGMQRPSAAGISPKGQGLLQALSGCFWRIASKT